MAKRSRILALVMAGVILFVVLAAAFFIAAEVNHSCIGDGCNICCQINACRVLLRGLALAVIAAVLAAAAAHVFGFRHALCRASFWHYTLVSLRVKLSN